MTITSLRTITLTKFSTESDWFSWPVTQPDTDLDNAVNAQYWLNDVTDTIVSASLRISPSGAGELEAKDLYALGNIVAARLANGIAGRLYLCEIQFMSLSGRNFMILVELPISSSLTTTFVSPPPSYDFGTPIVWTNGMTGFGTTFTQVSANVVATGSSQNTATLLTSVVNIITSGAVSTGVILPPTTIDTEPLSGTIIVQNDTTTDKLIYPSSGVYFETAAGALAVNLPVLISSGQRLNLSTADNTIKWAVA